MFKKTFKLFALLNNKFILLFLANKFFLLNLIEIIENHKNLLKYKQLAKNYNNLNIY